MHGIEPIIVVDSDALIAILAEDDALHTFAIQVFRSLIEKNAQIISPFTTLTETVTTCQRKLSSPILTEKVVTYIRTNSLITEEITADIFATALFLFRLHGSKQNTLFDAIVAAVAKKHEADAIFSFDDWYTKQGFRLAAELGY